MRRFSAILAVVAFLLSACRKEDSFPSLPEMDPVGEGETFDIENPMVRSYLDLLESYPYRDDDYGYSVIDGFWQIYTDYRKDRPSPATISWTRDPDCISQKVIVSGDPSFEDASSFSIRSSESSCGVYNMVPGRKYWWKVEAGFPDGAKMVLDTGFFTTTGRRRFLDIDNVCNVRDLGGIRTSDGRRIKYGLIFRGGEMDGGRFEDANSYYYDKFWQVDTYIRATQWIIDELKAGKPVYFHCIYGADRTGTLGFLIEALLGVGESDIATDYELTSFSFGLNSPPRRRGPNNEVSVYRYKEMLQGVKTSQIFSGSTLQERVRNFLVTGFPGAVRTPVAISETDLDWFVDYMIE